MTRLPLRPPASLPERAAAPRRGLLALLLAAALGMAASPAQAGPLTLEHLMATLAQVKSGEARFTEKRQVGELQQTLESSGRLSFNAPDTFVRETLKPRRERLAVSGNTVTMSQGQRSRTMALDSAPEAEAIVEAVRGTLTGNAAALERHFTQQLSGTLERWTLELVPREPRLRGQVARVAVTGRQAELREVRILLTDGDLSVMQIEPLAPDAGTK
ncbi:outer membrane lipoprotein carrier protein LolA [Aquabacterium sp. A7-Y]|uniref:LolA family protein n=1 Tax=Aquabacterium sp. A7-Y TaxID=1349605 RepID=UPI00223D7BC6|nr:outer membrane lipoprotein carrier protein LolA [Aquabacterium sp. A7-Y]MCW7536447.1 outer membrane lipoprotein carrier protein LolA [Aquabacterium sp. A7-Y]